jgi:hypothetical protein
MSQILRTFYRIFIKNSFIRWTWMLLLVLFGVRYATERGLAWKKTPLSKTVISIPAASVSTFTIRRGEEDEMTFTLADTGWLVVKNNVTLRLPIDSVQPYLSIFEKMDAVNINVLDDADFERLNNKQHSEIMITQSNNKDHSFSVFYTEKDSFSNQLITYIKLPNENALQGIKGDLLTVFNKQFDDYRDKTLLNVPKDSIRSLSFLTPIDSFSFFKRNNLWVSKNTKYRLLQTEFQQYLENLNILRGVKFFDGDHDILTQPKIQNQLIVYLPSDTIVLTNYKLEKGYILHSTQNNEAYFRFDSTSNVFPNLSNFLIIK